MTLVKSINTFPYSKKCNKRETTLVRSRNNAWCLMPSESYNPLVQPEYPTDVPGGFTISKCSGRGDEM